MVQEAEVEKANAAIINPVDSLLVLVSVWEVYINSSQTRLPLSGRKLANSIVSM